MATPKGTFTARPKRTSDGAVNAKYTKTKTAKLKPENKAENKTTATTLKKTAAKNAEKRAAKKTEDKALEKKPVRRAVFKSEAPKETKTKRESGRMRREHARREAAMRDRARAVSRGRRSLSSMELALSHKLDV